MRGLLDFADAPQPPPALDHDLVEVARLRRERRDRLVATSPSLTIAMLADARSISEDAARQWLHRHRRAGRLVTVQLHDGTTLIPSFQFDHDLDPRPETAVHTARLVAADMDGWGVWSWWVTVDGWLGRAPIDAVSTSPDEVAEAVARLVDPAG